MYYYYYITNNNKKKGPAGFEPATYRAATDCSTTELRPLYEYFKESTCF